MGGRRVARYLQSSVQSHSHTITTVQMDVEADDRRDRLSKQRKPVRHKELAQSLLPRVAWSRNERTAPYRHLEFRDSFAYIWKVATIFFLCVTCNIAQSDEYRV